MREKDGIVVKVLAFVMERVVWAGIAVGALYTALILGGGRILAVLLNPGGRFGARACTPGMGSALLAAFLVYLAAVVIIGPIWWNHERMRGRGMLAEIKGKSTQRW